MKEEEENQHTNKIAVRILLEEYHDYPQNWWHYDREYRMIVKLLDQYIRDNFKLRAVSGEEIKKIRPAAYPTAKHIFTSSTLTDQDIKNKKVILLLKDVLPEGSILIKHNHDYYSFYQSIEDYDNEIEFTCQGVNESFEDFIQSTINSLIQKEEENNDPEPLTKICNSIALSKLTTKEDSNSEVLSIPEDKIPELGESYIPDSNNKWEKQVPVLFANGKYYLIDELFTPEEIDRILNHCLNDLLVSGQKLGNSNDIAEYVSDWISKTDLPKPIEDLSELQN